MIFQSVGLGLRVVVMLPGALALYPPRQRAVIPSRLRAAVGELHMRR